jgi:Ca2+-binding RTX toxin-like protein
VLVLNSIPGYARMHIGRWIVCLLALAASCLLFASKAQADSCPAIADKPDSIAHVDYNGVQHLTYCYGPVSINPGQNIIRVNPTNLLPQEPGYITRFDPELVYTDGSVPPVDVLHLHHAVWLVNGNPQFAVGEEKTIVQLPQGFGWRSQPSDSWLLNDMLHDLVAKPATVYIVWRIDFVPDTSPDAATMHTVKTRWMDVAGLKVYPVFNALRGMGSGGTYTFPDQATGAARDAIGSAATWTPNHPVTLIQTAGHLHPGGLDTTLTVDRGGQSTTLFTSKAHYYEPAGAVSWDVAMGATPADWRVKVQAGDKLAVHATYDTARADWYEVMGIMPVAVYDGTDVGGVDAMSSDIPQNEVLTHTHLHENENHGGDSEVLANPLSLPGFPAASSGVRISGFNYYGDPNSYTNHNPPTITPGQTLSFKNADAAANVNAFHTITSCKEPCNRSTGIAYPLADGPVSFDSGQLGFNFAGFGAPAADRDTWTTPKDLAPGTYTYFCRVHPFMRGSFRVAPTNKCHGREATLIGTAGPDVIHGTKKADVIVGLGGNDKLIGLGGNDTICGGKGKDKLIGGSGKDRLFGEAGKDRLMGGSGKDKLRGGRGKDRLHQ